MKLEANNVRPDTIRGLEADFGSSTARYIFRKLAANLLFNHESYPIGFIKFFYQQQVLTDGNLIPPPNPEQWVLCDGSLISDSQSILDGRNAPNMVGLFPKYDAQDLVGGQNDINLRHNHNGNTAYASDAQDYNTDGGGGSHGGSFHRHSIPSNLSSTENVVPPFAEVQPYMRYK